MFVTGIILVIIQVIGIISSFIGGKNPFQGGVTHFLGYFLLGIIGIVLIVVSKKREKNKTNDISSQEDLTQNNDVGRNIIETKYYTIEKSFYDNEGWWNEFAPIIAGLVEEQIENFYYDKCINDFYSDDILEKIIEDSLKNISYFPEELKEKVKSNFFSIRDLYFPTGSLHKDEVASIIQVLFEHWGEMTDFKKEKYTKMFKQPFDQLAFEEELIINNLKCILYEFSLQSMDYRIGRFWRMVEVETEPKRYFALEFTYDNKYNLCEWVFDGIDEVGHINYGEIVSSPTEMLHCTERLKKKLEEILS